VVGAAAFTSLIDDGDDVDAGGPLPEAAPVAAAAAETDVWRLLITGAYRTGVEKTLTALDALCCGSWPTWRSTCVDDGRWCPRADVVLEDGDDSTASLRREIVALLAVALADFTVLCSSGFRFKLTSATALVGRRGDDADDDDNDDAEWGDADSWDNTPLLTDWRSATPDEADGRCRGVEDRALVPRRNSSSTLDAGVLTVRRLAGVDGADAAAEAVDLRGRFGVGHWARRGAFDIVVDAGVDCGWRERGNMGDEVVLTRPTESCDDVDRSRVAVEQTLEAEVLLVAPSPAADVLWEGGGKTLVVSETDASFVEILLLSAAAAAVAAATAAGEMTAADELHSHNSSYWKISVSPAVMSWTSPPDNALLSPTVSDSNPSSRPPLDIESVSSETARATVDWTDDVTASATTPLSWTSCWVVDCGVTAAPAFTPSTCGFVDSSQSPLSQTVLGFPLVADGAVALATAENESSWTLFWYSNDRRLNLFFIVSTLAMAVDGRVSGSRPHATASADGVWSPFVDDDEKSDVSVEPFPLSNAWASEFTMSAVVSVVGSWVIRVIPTLTSVGLLSATTRTAK
jgi:hypothetical protein